MDRDFRAETLEGFARHGFALDPGAVVGEEDGDFYRLVWGLAHFLAMCGLELNAVQPPMRLGDKVKVSEQICLCLNQLDSSFVLHPHQIMLLDWPSLRPITKAVCVMGEEAKLTGELLREGEGGEVAEPVEVDHDQLQALEQLVLDQQRELGVKSRQLAELDLEITEQSKSGEGGMEELSNLLREVDQLKAEEKEFKSTCRAERDRLLQFCVDPTPTTSMDQVELEHQKLDAMLKRHRVKLAGVSRLEANSRRKQDEGVTASERKQYEQRLVELYEEIALRSDMHRKQVAVFNSCTSKLRMVHGQIALLRSIRDGFLKSKGNAVAEHTFALQFPQVLAEYDASLAKAQDRMAGLDHDRVEVDDKLAKVYAQKRQYYQQQQQAN
ncbi:hypothetical protein BASA81_005426 [Batrachochytrium salamandrivorans]|nr:hypothetical protein BASA81_005426 [Batrachochytrium salamandrivorans]